MNSVKHSKTRGCLFRFLFILPLLMACAWYGMTWYTEKSSGTSDPVPSECDEFTIDLSHAKSIAKARKRIGSMMRSREIPGLSIAVSENGEVIWSQGFGYADLKTQQAVCPSTIFRIHSISKPLTASASMRLVQQGKLNPGTDIRKYIPEFPRKTDTINILQLATHRSGIRSYRDDSEALEIKRYPNVITSLDQFKEDALQFPPGSDFLYSGFGYITLSAVIERASGTPFLTYMQDEIFDHLGMRHTMPATMDGGSPGEARYYDNTRPYSTDGQMVISPPNDFSYKWAAGGFVSTPEDLLKFAHAHLAALNSGFLTKNSLDMLFTPATCQLAGLIGWGMGWMIARDLHLRKVIFHFGAGSGGTSMLVIYPRQKICIAILTNLGHARLPFNDLMFITNQFVPGIALRIVQLIIILYLVIAGILMIRKWPLHKKL